MKSIRMQHLLSLSASVALLAATCTAFAQTPASDTDKSFVEAALKGGMAEVELGQLAAKKGNSADVKAFGQRMATDHTRLGDKMKVVASEVGVTPPSMTTPSDIALKAELEVLSGDAFDNAYIKAMLKDHEEDLTDFKKEVSDGTSPAVKSAARQGEIVISHHLTMIKQLAQAHHVTE
jgi:putative membrane protein